MMPAVSAEVSGAPAAAIFPTLCSNSRECALESQSSRAGLRARDVKTNIGNRRLGGTLDAIVEARLRHLLGGHHLRDPSEAFVR